MNKYKGNIVIFVIVVMTSLNILAFSLGKNVIKQLRVSDKSLDAFNSRVEMSSYLSSTYKIVKDKEKEVFISYLQECNSYISRKITGEVRAGMVELFPVGTMERFLDNGGYKSTIISSAMPFTITQQSYESKRHISYHLNIENTDTGYKASIVYVVKTPDFTGEDKENIYGGNYEYLWQKYKDTAFLRKISYR